MHNLSSKFLIGVFLIFTISISTPNCAYAEKIEIKHADSLEAEKEQIIVMGNILINYKDAVIEALEGKIETNPDGETNKAIFSGGAKIGLKDRELIADKITVLINEKKIFAEGNTISKLKDKNNDQIIITCDKQELEWSGENASAKGNIKTSYKETNVNSEEAIVIYKNKRPVKVIFIGYSKNAILEQPSNVTTAKEFIFDINTHNVLASGNVKSTVWANSKKDRFEQDPVYLKTEKLFIDKDSGTITAESKQNKVDISYLETKGQSKEAILLRNKVSGKPEKLIFIGNADVIHENKQITSEEVVFNFNDKKLTSNTKTNIRPKTLIFKNN